MAVGKMRTADLRIIGLLLVKMQMSLRTKRSPNSNPDPILPLYDPQIRKFAVLILLGSSKIRVVFGITSIS